MKFVIVRILVIGALVMSSPLVASSLTCKSLVPSLGNSFYQSYHGSIDIFDVDFSVEDAATAVTNEIMAVAGEADNAFELELLQYTAACDAQLQFANPILEISDDGYSWVPFNTAIYDPAKRRQQIDKVTATGSGKTVAAVSYLKHPVLPYSSTHPTDDINYCRCRDAGVGE